MASLLAVTLFHTKYTPQQTGVKCQVIKRCSDATQKSFLFHGVHTVSPSKLSAQDSWTTLSSVKATHIEKLPASPTGSILFNNPSTSSINQRGHRGSVSDPASSRDTRVITSYKGRMKLSQAQENVVFSYCIRNTDTHPNTKPFI